MSALHSPWSLRHSAAELHHGLISGSVELERPDKGLESLSFMRTPLPGRWLCMQRIDSERSSANNSSWPLPLADAYIRGGDLVASYAPSASWPYSPQIYWRATSFDECRGVASSLALLLSVQTHLLDTWPRIGISSELVCSEVLEVRPDAPSAHRAASLTEDAIVQPSEKACCILRRLGDLPFSYAELMPSNDFHELHVSRAANGECRVEWHVFGEFLEKGVIRRARLEALFLPREDDVRLAAACCDAIDRRPLPLTT